MNGSIRLTAAERKALLKVYRTGRDTKQARRAHVILLLDDGMSYRELRRWLFVSNDLIADCVRRFQQGRVEALFGERLSASEVVPSWLRSIQQWLEAKTPQDFGYFRTRWSCEILAEVLAWEKGVRLSGESVRRGLHRLGFVWRRPRPVVGPRDPDHEEKLWRIHRLLAEMPADETAVFQDEVDVNLNPKIGACWMRCGQQAAVVTPGNNVKRYLAGSLHWRTGTLLVSLPDTRRNTRLFLAHLDDLRQRLRGYRMIHVICDNAPFHRSGHVQEYLVRWSHRLRVHFLPKYAPETNPIERVWWHLHETITRNHQCQTIDELLEDVSEYLTVNHNHYAEMRSITTLAA